jgi:hypothetical protein
MPTLRIKNQKQAELVAEVQQKASDILKRSPTSDLLLVVYEKQSAQIYYEKPRAPKA